MSSSSLSSSSSSSYLTFDYFINTYFNVNDTGSMYEVYVNQDIIEYQYKHKKELMKDNILYRMYLRFFNKEDSPENQTDFYLNLMKY